MIYLTGSLRNPKVPVLAEYLRAKTGAEIFDDWFAAGPEADDYWQKYEKGRGRSYAQALQGKAVRNVFLFDLCNLDASDAGIILLPAGKSAHTEGGYLRGQGKPVFLLFDGEPKPEERWDAMYKFYIPMFDPLVLANEIIKRGLK